MHEHDDDDDYLDRRRLRVRVPCVLEDEDAALSTGFVADATQSAPLTQLQLARVELGCPTIAHLSGSAEASKRE